MRYAIIAGSASAVAAYLPQDYSVLVENEGRTLIGGKDNRGWTLEDYVLPRLASGLYFGNEVSVDEAVHFAATAP